MSQSLLKLYNEHPYEPLVPTASNPDQMVFKFNSPTHFLSWIEELDKRFKRGSTENSSDTERESFTQSLNLADAFNKVRETKFESDDADQLQAKIAELKKGTMFSDEGYELDIPEYLSGSDRVWIKERRKKTPTRVIDDVLLIEATYNAGRSAAVAKKMGMALLSGIYRRRVVPRKIVLAYAGLGIRNSGGQHMTTIDVSFQDLHGIAKILHPSAFRRLWFRIAEIYPDLAYGYGRPPTFSTTKGSMTFETAYDVYENGPAYFDKEIDKFLGVTTK